MAVLHEHTGSYLWVIPLLYKTNTRALERKKVTATIIKHIAFNVIAILRIVYSGLSDHNAKMSN